MFVKSITVNELDDILQRHFKTKNVFIEAIEVADIETQHRPRRWKIGVGGVCTITFTSTRKLKGAYPC